MSYSSTVNTFGTETLDADTFRFAESRNSIMQSVDPVLDAASDNSGTYAAPGPNAGVVFIPVGGIHEVPDPDPGIIFIPVGGFDDFG